MTEPSLDTLAGDLTTFQLDILAVVQSGPHKGLDIKAGVQAHRGTEINHGRLYPNLDELAALGLIEKGTYDDRTNCYEITDRGDELLRRRAAWLTEGPSENHSTIEEPIGGGDA